MTSEKLSFEKAPVILRWTALALLVLCAVTLYPLAMPLILAAWVAAMSRNWFDLLAERVNGRHRSAAILVFVLFVVMVIPVVIAVGSLVRGAADIAQNVGKSPDAKDALRELVSGGQPFEIENFLKPEKIIELVQEHGRDAATLLGTLFGAAAKTLVAIFIFLYATFIFLVDGPDQWKWAESRAPLAASTMNRFKSAFHETGRGLFVGIGLTGLAQGAIATIAYIALGVPRAIVLGLITCVCSLIPSVGTALVWVPVTAGLAVSGRTGAAIAMGLVGVGAVSTIDNILRPAFARFGKLNLSGFVLLISIFGGLAVFGTWGLFLGPLFVRLAKEALEIVREEH